MDTYCLGKGPERINNHDFKSHTQMVIFSLKPDVHSWGPFPISRTRCSLVTGDGRHWWYIWHNHRMMTLWLVCVAPVSEGLSLQYQLPYHKWLWRTASLLPRLANSSWLQTLVENWGNNKVLWTCFFFREAEWVHQSLVPCFPFLMAHTVD